MTSKLRNIFTSLALIGLIAAATAFEGAKGFAQDGMLAANNAPQAEAIVAAVLAPAANDDAAARADGWVASAGANWAAGAREAASMDAPPGAIAGATAADGLPV